MLVFQIMDRRLLTFIISADILKLGCHIYIWYLQGCSSMSYNINVILKVKDFCLCMNFIIKCLEASSQKKLHVNFICHKMLPLSSLLPVFMLHITKEQFTVALNLIHEHKMDVKQRTTESDTNKLQLMSRS